MFRRILDSPWLYFALAAILLVVLIARTVDIQVPARDVAGPEAIRSLAERDDVNVLFILVDTLRADHLGPWGYERPTTPILDDIAQAAVRFDKVRSHSTWTKTSMASLWTGVYPQRHGLHRHDDGLSESVTMPAEIFREAGFRTAGIFRNEWVAENFGFAQGFELYQKPVPSRNPEKVQANAPGGQVLRGTDLDVTDAAKEFLRAYRNERFLLYLHYMDVHQYLYSLQSALFGTRYIDAYDNAIHWTDRNIGEVLATLQELGNLENTLVVLASDHGEAFLERGTEGHARDLYKETVHVPLLFSFPFRLEGPVVVEPLVRNVDIWPTILDLVGLPPLPQSDGVSLVPLMVAAAEGEPTAELAPPDAYAQLDQTWGHVKREPAPLVSVTQGDHRLMYRPRAPEQLELYDVAADFSERKNIATEKPDLAEELIAKAEAYLALEPPPESTTEVDLDEQTLGQLRALGYAIETE